MNRRGFLKRIGQTIAGLMVVPSVVKAKKKEPKLTEDMKMANAILECYEELGRPIGPLAQLRKGLREHEERAQRDKMFMRGMSKAFIKKVLLKEQMT